jgi:hypothetical protein
MSKHSVLVLVLVVVGCSSPPVGPVAGPPEEPLSAEAAKSALLAMMRTEPAKKLGWFDGDVPDGMAKYEIEEETDGWYAWTAAYRFHPATAVYTLVVRPRPGARACTFEYRGSFVRQGDKWTATPPELVRTVLGGGE